MSETMEPAPLPDEIKRWTAKRRTALVLEILRGQTTPQKAAKEHGLKARDVEHWRDTFLASGENALRSNPKEEVERRDAEIRKLKQKVGELVMDVDILQEVQRRAKADPFSSGWSSDE